MTRFQTIPVSPAKKAGSALGIFAIGLLLLIVGILILFTPIFPWGIILAIFAISVIRWGYISYRDLDINRELEIRASARKAVESAAIAALTAPNRTEWLTRGEALMEQKQYGAAEAAFMNAVHLDENSVQAWFFLAQSADLVGDTSTANWARGKLARLQAQH